MHVKRGTFVVEDAQLGDLASNGRDLSGSVAALDTQEDNEALARSAGTLPRRELRPGTWTRLMVAVMRLAGGPDLGILLGSGP